MIEQRALPPAKPHWVGATGRTYVSLGLIFLFALSMIGAILTQRYFHELRVASQNARNLATTIAFAWQEQLHRQGGTGSLDRQQLTQLLARLTLGDSALISLHDGQGRVVMMHPPPLDQTMVDHFSPLGEVALNATAGTFDVASHYDGARRIGGFSRVGNADLVVKVGLSQDEILVAWRRAVMIAVVVMLVTFAGALKLTAWVLRVRDGQVTAQREAEEHAQLKQTIADATPSLIALQDFDGRFVFLNQGLCDILGIRPETAVGCTVAEFGPAPLASCFATEAIGEFASQTASVPASMEKTVTPSAAAERKSYLLQRQSLTMGDGRLAVLSVLTDVSELQSAREAAEAASRAKSEFLSSMSHELRTPLNAILGFAQLLACDRGLSPEHRDDARAIERGGLSLLRLVNDVIYLSRIESGRIDLNLLRQTLPPIVNQSLERVAAAAKDVGVTIHNRVDAELEVVIEVDSERLQQVLLHLLSNAIKYNRRGGSVTISCAQGADSARILVSDTGLGISAGMHERVFAAFDRLGFENGAIEGVGIGLVIANRIVVAMKGSIGFESIEGSGSSFWVEFPLVKAGG